MNKDVLVKIKAGITSGQESEDIVVKSDGLFYEKDDCCYVIYDEETEEGSINKCRLKIKDSELELKKTGMYSTLMCFTRENPTKTSYRTPFGILNFTINTSQLDIFITDKEIKIRLEYDMGVDDKQSSCHKMEIVISQK